MTKILCGLIPSAMFPLKKQDADDNQTNSFDAGILEQSFAQLPVEERGILKDFLKNLLSMQNTITRAISSGETTSVKKEVI